MKMRIACNVKKGLAVCFLMSSFMIFVHAQKTTLTLENGKATVRRSFQPRKQADAHFYFLKLRRGQTVEIKVVSTSVLLSEENECGVYFEIFDAKGKKLFLGDSPTGIDEWEGEIGETGIYKIRIYMSCLEAFSTADLQKKKPRFGYSLKALIG